MTWCIVISSIPIQLSTIIWMDYQLAMMSYAFVFLPNSTFFQSTHNTLLFFFKWSSILLYRILCTNLLQYSQWGLWISSSIGEITLMCSWTNVEATCHSYWVGATAYLFPLPNFLWAYTWQSTDTQVAKPICSVTQFDKRLRVERF